ncbi:MAG TPA: molybdopterin-dependent oxidoreductase [Dokdonella sp.]|uniref:molybdopterin-dependent oxidoreductase n=1 Tax=Dokdonella sp. TaxID=2291710 RepID=UPI002BF90506|nr:molybdopterin-dependent oxidoreductase [Dokdonella sp.]HUD43485.1 molybdopterin-dependent oxidoreductase [Dokdonella sp.]
MTSYASFAAHRPRIAHRLAWMLAGAVAVIGTSAPAQDTHDRHAHAGPAAETDAVVKIGGEVAKPLTLDAALLARLPRSKVKAAAHGVEGEWEGVSLIEMLRAAGAPVGAALRGQDLQLYVRVSAADGYRVVYALAELDPAFRDDGVILADRRDGRPIAGDEGPFRLIAPREARPGRWVRQVIAIDVLRAAR